MTPSAAEQTLNAHVAAAPPADLDDAACSEWRRVTALQRFHPNQLTLLRAYCESWSRWTASAALLQAEGDLIERTISRGRTRLVENPRVKIVIRYQRQTVGFARQLGLNKTKPSDDFVDVDDYNPFSALLEDDFGSPEWHERHDLLGEAWTRRNYSSRGWDHDFDDQLGTFEGPGINGTTAERNEWDALNGR